MSFVKKKYLDKEFEGLTFRESVDAPVHAISGVTEDDASKLEEAFGIKTIGDLARNKYICIAEAITAFADYSDEILDKAYESEKFRRIAEEPVEAIAGISKRDAQLLKEAFNIDTIRDLAECKYAQVARTILGLAILEELLEA